MTLSFPHHHLPTASGAGRWMRCRPEAAGSRLRVDDERHWPSGGGYRCVQPGGSEVGPGHRQASLAQLVLAQQRTSLLRAISSSVPSPPRRERWWAGPLRARCSPQDVAVAVVSILLWVRGVWPVLFALFARLTPTVEAAASTCGRRVLDFTPAAVTAVFAFALTPRGGFIAELMALCSIRFAPTSHLGGLFFKPRICAAAVSLPHRARIGLINTMVVTHLCRTSSCVWCCHAQRGARGRRVGAVPISQMDATRRRHHAIVDPDGARRRPESRGSRVPWGVLSPALERGLMATVALSSLPFFLAGGLKIVYDLLVYRGFRSVRAPEE
jgi:hypothetical protein